MAEPASFLEVPPDRRRIVRYMKGDYYADLVTRRELYFTRLDRFDDRLEGRRPHANIAAANAYFVEKGIRPEHLADRPGSWGDRIMQVFRATRHASCWHLSNYESQYHWTTFCPRGFGVAIVSTVGALRESIRNPPRRLLLGRVQYRNLRIDPAPEDAFDRLAFTKDDALSPEQEFRAVVADDARFNAALLLRGRGLEGPVDANGVRAPVDLATLIHRVIITPGITSSATNDRVGELHHKHGIAVEVCRSVVDAPPVP